MLVIAIHLTGIKQVNEEAGRESGCRPLSKDPCSAMDDETPKWRGLSYESPVSPDCCTSWPGDKELSTSVPMTYLVLEIRIGAKTAQ